MRALPSRSLVSFPPCLRTKLPPGALQIIAFAEVRLSSSPQWAGPSSAVLLCLCMSRSGTGGVSADAYDVLDMVLAWSDARVPQQATRLCCLRPPAEGPKMMLQALGADRKSSAALQPIVAHLGRMQGVWGGCQLRPDECPCGCKSRPHLLLAGGGNVHRACLTL